jgi:hypothetical protein
LGFQSGLFPLGPFRLQSDQLVQTSLFPSRLAAAQSSDHPQSIILSASPKAPLSRKTDSKFTEQLSLCQNIYTDLKKH